VISLKNIYEKIIEDVELDIKNEVYKPGKKLPSVRELSEKYKCSKNTVVKAYEILKNNHIIYSISQSGYYIVEKLIKSEKVSSSVINFLSGNPIIGNTNTPDLKHCLDRAVDIYKNNSLSSNSGGGVDSLKNILPKYLSDFQVFTSQNNIFVNLGIQQALSILTQMPFPNDKELILIEQPTYKYFIQFLKFYGAKVLGIERDENGIDLNRLEDIFKSQRVKFFYTVPRNHSPLGTSYSKSQRKAVAELATKYDVYIVEDDYFADISLDKKYDPIYAYGDHEHHIYLKSFSKVLPWMRIGLVVVPNSLLDIFKVYTKLSYYYSYFSASLVSQATLEIYIRSNILKKHVASITKELEEKQKHLKKGLIKLEKYGVKPIGGKCGFYSYLCLPKDIVENKLVENLKQQQVLVSAGKQFFLNDYFYKKGVRLSIACTNSNDIKRGIEILCTQLERYI
jgi:DNA-binding transcriptional MocR family regulator